MTTGQFVWRELETTNIAACRTFYSELFGWVPREQDMGAPEPYVLFRHATLDRDTAGAMSTSMPGVPSHWLDYAAVPDADDGLARAVELGGKQITEVLTIPGVGRFAVVEDAVGAVLAVFQAADSEGSGAESPPLTGTFCWSQLMTADRDRAVQFYSALFGWTPAPMGPGATVMMDGEVMRCSVRDSDAPYSHWLKYVAVDDTDASFAKAKQLGAQALAEPTTMPGMGRFAVLTDPSGATFALWKDLSQRP